MDFKKLTRLLVPIVVEGVLSARRSSHDRLIDMLGELEFSTRNIIVTKDKFIIELQILDVDLLYSLLAGEANKFFLASRLSYDRSIQGQLNNASWQMVEHYYSAYYGVHYLLRLTGVSLTNLDVRSTNAIIRSYFGSLVLPEVPGGLYVMYYDDYSKILTLKKNLKKGSGGSHQEVWSLWKDLVDKLYTETNSDLVEYLSTAVELAMHKNFLVRSTGKYSPSEIRAEINYQFKGGSWLFEVNAANSIDKMKRFILNEKSPVLIKSSTPEGMILNNKLIIGLAKAIFLHAAEKYPKSICRSMSNKYSAYVQ